MMDRIEDETIRYLFFMRIESGEPPLPYPEPDDDDDSEEDSEEDLVSVSAAQRQAAQRLADQQASAQQSVLDLTRNIQKKKDRELAQLQVGGGEASSQTQTINKGPKVGRNDMCPCGSRKKYKKCHGAA
jgi:preprotein translocase subunit SecA